MARPTSTRSETAKASTAARVAATRDDTPPDAVESDRSSRIGTITLGRDTAPAGNITPTPIVSEGLYEFNTFTMFGELMGPGLYGIMGGAGTGKTYLINDLREAMASINRESSLVKFGEPTSLAEISAGEKAIPSGDVSVFRSALDEQWGGTTPVVLVDSLRIFSGTPVSGAAGQFGSNPVFHLELLTIHNQLVAAGCTMFAVVNPDNTNAEYLMTLRDRLAGSIGGLIALQNDFGTLEISTRDRRDWRTQSRTLVSALETARSGSSAPDMSFGTPVLLR